MRQCAALHGNGQAHFSHHVHADVVAGCIFETTIPTISEKGFSLEKIILWATSRTGSSSSGTPDQRMPPDEVEAVRFLQRCFELDPDARISADEALQHEFLYIDPQDESA